MRRYLQILVASLFCFSGAVPATWASDPGGEEAGATEVATASLDNLGLSEALQEMFTSVDDDDQPVLGIEARQYYAALPSHARDLVEKAVDEGLVSRAEHLRDLLALDLDVSDFELMFSDNCLLCHSDEEMQTEETWMRLDPTADTGSSHLSIPDFITGVHFRKGLSCSGCHGGTPDVLEMPDEVYEAWPDYDIRHEDRSWIPEFCGKCHSDPVFMRGYAPSLPTDQVAKYRTSRHGILLLQKGDNGVAQCVSCHGVHGILGPDSRNSKVHPQAIPETCGHCHSDKKLMAGRKLADGSPMPTNQLAQYRESVHGRALLEKGDLGAPACNDCHGNHAAMPPAVSHVSQVCRTCHALNGKLFDGSNHKRAFEEHKWPECETCHGKHDISKTSDAMLGTAPGDLCYDCHTKYSSKKDECIRTADHFHETIDKMAAAEDLFTEKGEWMAEHGLDNQSLEEVRANLHDALRTSRTTIHAFDRSDFDEAAQAGLAAVKKGDELLVKGHEEFTFRRKGLIIALLVMVFLAVVLAMKIRQIERHS